MRFFCAGADRSPRARRWAGEGDRASSGLAPGRGNRGLRHLLAGAPGTRGPRTQDRGLAVGKADGAKAPDGPNHAACSHHRFGHPPPEPPTYPQNRGIALGIVGLSCAGFGEIGSAGFSGRRDGTRVSRPPSSDDGDIHPGEERPGNRVTSFRAGEQWKRAIGFCIAYSSLRSFSR